MNFSYYACKQDRVSILDYILGEKHWQLYDANLFSEFEHIRPRPYLKAEDVEVKIKNQKGSARFVLYSSEFEGEMLFTRTTFNSKKSESIEYRYSPEGWGVIQLEFGTIWNDSLQRSMISHNSEKRAIGWADTIPRFGKPELWNWKEVNRTSRKIGNLIKKLSVTKFHDGSYVSYVMPNAIEILKLIRVY